MTWAAPEKDAHEKLKAFLYDFFSTLPKNLQSNQCNTGHL